MSTSKKALASVFVSGLGNDICNPFFDPSGTLHVIRQSIGSILAIDSVGNSQTIINTGGQPSFATFNNEEIMYVTDFGHGAVLAFSKDGQQELVVGVYEDKPLKGPNSICSIGSDIFFTDSGAFGETGLHSSVGSVFTIGNTPSGQVLKPISLGNLAYPSGIAVTEDRKFIYVAETMKNRILRFFQQPAGVYHGSVFYQCSGGVGPMSLALDSSGNLFVGHYDTKESSDEGTVSMLSPSGKLVRTVFTPGAEISGVTIRNGILYMTERSTGSILKYDL